jgi:hypothetical protein
VKYQEEGLATIVRKFETTADYRKAVKVDPNVAEEA